VIHQKPGRTWDLGMWIWIDMGIANNKIGISEMISWGLKDV
jgi:hypothetical protein